METNPREWTNEEWWEALDGGPNYELAIVGLRDIIFRGLRYALSNKIDTDLEAVTEDFTQDAILKILDKRHTFRGESKFTTWAQKVAVRVALSELRRHRWRDISYEKITDRDDGSIFIPIDFADEHPGPEDRSSRAGMMRLVARLIRDELTPRQRKAMTLLMVQGLSIEHVAERMDTNRNALYKLVHDARVRLKAALEEQNLTPEEVLETFS